MRLPAGAWRRDMLRVGRVYRPHDAKPASRNSFHVIVPALEQGRRLQSTNNGTTNHLRSKIMSYGRKLSYEKILQISMGEYRLFVSVRRFGMELSVGLPLANCRNKKAWVDDAGDKKYLSLPKAKKLLRNALGQSRFRELAGYPGVRGLL